MALAMATISRQAVLLRHLAAGGGGDASSRSSSSSSSSSGSGRVRLALIGVGSGTGGSGIGQRHMAHALDEPNMFDVIAVGAACCFFSNG